jgi:hypothetical protein
MRGLWLSLLLIAGLAAAAPLTHEVRAKAGPAAAQSTRTVTRGGAPASSPVVGSARAPVSPGVAPPRPPSTLALPAHPGKNPAVGLGGAAHYDAKKAAVLGGTVMPHRR